MWLGFAEKKLVLERGPITPALSLNGRGRTRVVFLVGFLTGFFEGWGVAVATGLFFAPS